LTSTLSDGLDRPFRVVHLLSVHAKGLGTCSSGPSGGAKVERSRRSREAVKFKTNWTGPTLKSSLLFLPLLLVLLRVRRVVSRFLSCFCTLCFRVFVSFSYLISTPRESLLQKGYLATTVCDTIRINQRHSWTRCEIKSSSTRSFTNDTIRLFTLTIPP
jgi:hypothetical protein